ncbi:hypothetical protein SVAN01_03971 [Stagonosporopsis vannaccii]|nr:hypothetical protein SVAN01_03971 [Stagonosporopsis vannaccii]
MPNGMRRTGTLKLSARILVWIVMQLLCDGDEMTSVYTVAQNVQAPFPPSNDQPPVFNLTTIMQQPAVNNRFGNIPDLLQACSYLTKGSCVIAALC